MIRTEIRMLVWIRLQCFLLSKRDGHNAPLRCLWLMEIDESTPPFSCMGFEMSSGNISTEQFVSRPILSQLCGLPRFSPLDALDTLFCYCHSSIWALFASAPDERWT